MNQVAQPLWQFPGGLHLDKQAALSHHRIAVSTVPPYLIIPLLQHIGEPAQPIVKVGDYVYKGQIIAQCADAHCDVPKIAPIHASSSGTVSAIELRSVVHPSGLEAMCVVIETDGKEVWNSDDRSPLKCTGMTPEQLRHLVAQAGIVGLGGAGFPAHLKLRPGDIDTLILNGAECEPYISCDDYLMRERPEQVVIGARILSYALGGVKRCIIAVEDNKPEAFAALQAVAHKDEEQFKIATQQLDVVQVPTLYPMGGEQQLIRTLTGKALPRSHLPKEVGIVMHNVGTAAAIYQATKQRSPLLSRIVTVTGDAVEIQQNMEVLLGTPMQHVLQQCGLKADMARLIAGGPMMGTALHSAELPIVKVSNCLIASTAEHLQNTAPTMPCIRCGSCERVCPAQLLPQQLYWYARSKDFDKAQDFNLFDCIECGCCAYVCPSQLPLVHYYRYAKSEIRTQVSERKKADAARRRFEFKTFRLAREKEERQARHQQKRAPVKSGVKAEDKKAVIQAAVDRAKAKKAAPSEEV